mgnify:CR=1 FL=1
MDLETCLKKLKYIGVLAFATVDLEGAPQIRNISAIHYEKDAIYFFTARGKEFCRELLEDGRVQISRVSGTAVFPARFMLVCAMNPCKCGWYGDPSDRCICSQAAVETYQSRISGPLLDRIDLIVDVPALQYEDLRRKETAETSADIRQRVNAARQRQHRRFQELNIHCNARMSSAQTQKFCTLSEACSQLMKAAFQSMNLTARSYDRILRVARTIADLDDCTEIQPNHVAEAIQYRATALGG